MTQESTVVIIGAGLTGLVTAHRLKKSGVNVTLIEKGDRPGGVIHTIKENGFTMEAGPNTGVISQPEIMVLFDDLEGKCTLEIANREAKKRWIWKNGRWVALPSGLIEGITTPLFTFYDKLRILGEPFRKRGTNPDESIADLVLRRMGRSYLDYAVDPFISGIYAGDPTRLVTRFALPKLYRLEQDYGSFIGGAIKKRSEIKDAKTLRPTKEVFSVNGGLQNLIDALVESIGAENILLNCQNTTIRISEDNHSEAIKQNINKTYTVAFEREGQSFAIDTNQVISTVYGKAIESLFPFIDPLYAKAMKDLDYARIVQVALGYHQWKGVPIDAFGGLIPSKENRKILGILFPSSCFSNRAPKEGALLSVFLGGIKHDEICDLNDEQIQSLVEKEVSELLQINDIKADMIRIFRYQHAIPQYYKSTKLRLMAIHHFQQDYPGLFLAGSIRDGIGMGDRIKQGFQLAEEVLKK